MYVVYQIIIKHPKTKARSGPSPFSDPDPYPEQEIPVLIPVSVTVVSRSKEENYTRAQAFVAKFKEIVMVEKTKRELIILYPLPKYRRFYYCWINIVIGVYLI